MNRKDAAGGQTGVCMQCRPGRVGPGTPIWSPNIKGPQQGCSVYPSLEGFKKQEGGDYNGRPSWDRLGQIRQGDQGEGGQEGPTLCSSPHGDPKPLKQSGLKGPGPRRDLGSPRPWHRRDRDSMETRGPGSGNVTPAVPGCTMRLDSCVRGKQIPASPFPPKHACTGNR